MANTGSVHDCSTWWGNHNLYGCITTMNTCCWYCCCCRCCCMIEAEQQLHVLSPAHLWHVDVHHDRLARCAIAVCADGGADGLRQRHCDKNSRKCSRGECFNDPTAGQNIRHLCTHAQTLSDACDKDRCSGAYRPVHGLTEARACCCTGESSAGRVRSGCCWPSGRWSA